MDHRPTPFGVTRAEAAADRAAAAATLARFAALIMRERDVIKGPASSHPLPSHPTAIRALTVCVRKRPLNSDEHAQGQLDVLTPSPSRTSLVLHEPRTRYDLTQHVVSHPFAFDRAFGEDVTTRDIYASTLAPLVSRLDRGCQFTCFAYGQTGSGKSYTMGGLTERAVDDVLALLHSPANAGRQLAVCVSAFEIYCSKVYDLLNGRALCPLREDGNGAVHVVGLVEHATRDARVVRELIARATAGRSIGTTKVNADSSRSHAVLQLLVREGAAGGGGGGDDDAYWAAGGGTGGRLVGKVSLVDLAGSEQASESAPPDAQTHYEAAEINKSLLALKECIRAMGRAQFLTGRRAALGVKGAGTRGKGTRKAPPSSSLVRQSVDGAQLARAVAAARNSANGRRSSLPGRRTRVGPGTGEPVSSEGDDDDDDDDEDYAEGQYDDNTGDYDYEDAVDARVMAARGGAQGVSATRPRTAAASGAATSSRASAYGVLAKKPALPSSRPRGGRTPHTHIPFRGSKLTQILRDCFTTPGAVTVMVATLSPGHVAADHTLNTLRYADRLKEIGRKSATGDGASGEGGGAQSIAESGGGSATGVVSTGLLVENPAGTRVGVLWNKDGKEVWPGEGRAPKGLVAPSAASSRATAAATARAAEPPPPIPIAAPPRGTWNASSAPAPIDSAPNKEQREHRARDARTETTAAAKARGAASTRLASAGQTRAPAAGPPPIPVAGRRDLPPPAPTAGEASTDPASQAQIVALLDAQIQELMSLRQRMAVAPQPATGVARGPAAPVPPAPVVSPARHGRVAGARETAATAAASPPPPPPPAARTSLGVPRVSAGGTAGSRGGAAGGAGPLVLSHHHHQPQQQTGPGADTGASPVRGDKGALLDAAAAPVWRISSPPVAKPAEGRAGAGRANRVAGGEGGGRGGGAGGGGVRVVIADPGATQDFRESMAVAASVVAADEDVGNDPAHHPATQLRQAAARHRADAAAASRAAVEAGARAAAAAAAAGRPPPSHSPVGAGPGGHGIHSMPATAAATTAAAANSPPQQQGRGGAAKTRVSAGSPTVAPAAQVASTPVAPRHADTRVSGNTIRVTALTSRAPREGDRVVAASRPATASGPAPSASLRGPPGATVAAAAIAAAANPSPYAQPIVALYARARRASGASSGSQGSRPSSAGPDGRGGGTHDRTARPSTASAAPAPAAPVSFHQRVGGITTTSARHTAAQPSSLLQNHPRATVSLDDDLPTSPPRPPVLSGQGAAAQTSATRAAVGPRPGGGDRERRDRLFLSKGVPSPPSDAAAATGAMLSIPLAALSPQSAVLAAAGGRPVSALTLLNGAEASGQRRPQAAATLVSSLPAASRKAISAAAAAYGRSGR
jgi:hypothetical protein